MRFLLLSLLDKFPEYGLPIGKRRHTPKMNASQQAQPNWRLTPHAHLPGHHTWPFQIHAALLKIKRKGQTTQPRRHLAVSQLKIIPTNEVHNAQRVHNSFNPRRQKADKAKIPRPGPTTPAIKYRTRRHSAPTAPQVIVVGRSRAAGHRRTSATETAWAPQTAAALGISPEACTWS